MPETRQKYWIKLIREQEASAQKVRPFCRERGLGEHSFYYWRRRLRTDQPVRFAVLEAKPGMEALAEAFTLELVLTNGELLRIGERVDVATLRMVLEAVRG